MLKTIVYIDGFNLYYAIRSMGCKWLDVMALPRRMLRSPYTVQAVNYYTARVSGILDPGQPGRQQVYFSALKTVPGIRIILGNFLAKTVCRPLANIPIANRAVIAGAQILVSPAGNRQVMPDATRTDSRQEVMPVGSYPLKTGKINPRLAPIQDGLRVHVHWMEEKGSDVKLASHLINDALAGRYDAAAVLSNDTDLVEPIRIVTKELGRPVVLLSAAARGAAPALKAVATNVLHISGTHLRASLFPNTIPGTSITKPRTWWGCHLR
jgi:uncharacterized LabA/DUF88 family protein